MILDVVSIRLFRMDEIVETISKAVPDAEVIVNDPMRDGVHLEAIVVSASFEGKPLVQRHRMVMQSLSTHFQSSLHALSLRTLTPAQWKGERE